MPSFYLATGHGQSTDGAWDTGTVLSFVDNTHAHNQAGGIKPYEFRSMAPRGSQQLTY